MQLTDADIAKLGTLGRLEISPDKRRAYAEQLSRIVEYTDRIAEGDVSATHSHLRAPLAPDELRPDVVQPTDDAGLVELAPKREGRFIVSPPIA